MEAAAKSNLKKVRKRSQFVLTSSQPTLSVGVVRARWKITSPHLWVGRFRTRWIPNHFCVSYHWFAFFNYAFLWKHTVEVSTCRRFGFFPYYESQSQVPDKDAVCILRFQFNVTYRSGRPVAHFNSYPHVWAIPPDGGDWSWSRTSSTYFNASGFYYLLYRRRRRSAHNWPGRAGTSRLNPLHTILFLLPLFQWMAKLADVRFIQ